MQCHIQVQAASLLGPHQQAADLVVIKVGVQFGQHANAHPVLGLCIDRAAQRVAGDPQVFVHLLGYLDDAHQRSNMKCIWNVY